MKIKFQSNPILESLNLEPNKSISEINSPLKPFYYLANKMIQTNKNSRELKIRS